MLGRNTESREGKQRHLLRACHAMPRRLTPPLAALLRTAQSELALQFRLNEQQQEVLQQCRSVAGGAAARPQGF